MRFNYFLTTYLPHREYGGDRLYREMIEQAVLADRLGFDSISIPEHHLINVLLVPSPLQMAVRIAAETRHVDIVTSIAVLPIRDMRVFAGEVVQADILCEGRLVLGVGRGAFGYELERLGTPLAETRAKFDESLNVLEALLSGRPTSWDGTYYTFDTISVMPPPVRDIRLMVAVMAPEGIYASAKRGFNIQTTPLQASHETLLEQVNAFHRGKQAAGARGKDIQLSLQRVTYLARDDADARAKAEAVYDYYKRFDNVFSGPGIVRDGIIEPLPRKQSLEEMMDNLLICPAAEMIDRLSVYAEAGIDEVIMSCSFGQDQAEMLDMMQRFAAEIMPHVAKPAHRAMPDQQPAAARA